MRSVTGPWGPGSTGGPCRMLRRGQTPDDHMHRTNVLRSVVVRAIAALASIVQVATSPAVAGDWTVLHLESFVSATGPRDEAGPPMAIEWCRLDGRMVSNGFCPTGSAWRLDPGDRIVATLRPTPGCGRLRVWIYAASLDAPTAWMRLGPVSGCLPNSGATVPVPTVGGACLDLSIEEDVVSDEGLQWMLVNPGPAVLLVDELLVEGLACADPEMHECCETGGPGCADEDVSACVCAADPWCCEVAWDAICVGTVDEAGCGACGESCAAMLATDFGTAYVPGGVCSALPELFEACEGTGPFLTISGGCAGIGDAALRFGGGFPWSMVETRCLDFTDAGTARLRCTVSVAAGVSGPVFEARIGDQSPFELGRVGVSSNAGCRDVEIDLTPVIGHADVRIRIRSGSSVADATRLDDLVIEADPTHPPCVIGGPGCDEPTIESCVCGIDAFCCDSEWDALCVTIATLVCGAGCEEIPTCGQPGACEVVHGTPGCEDEACCGPVCSLDPYCCVVAWDEACVAEAAAACGMPSPDLDGDGRVDGADLGLLLAGWGSADPTLDLDGDGSVGGGDLGLLLAAWTVG